MAPTAEAMKNVTRKIRDGLTAISRAASRSCDTALIWRPSRVFPSTKNSAATMCQDGRQQYRTATSNLGIMKPPTLRPPLAIRGKGCGLLPFGKPFRMISRRTIPSATVATSAIIAGALRNRWMTRISSTTPSNPVRMIASSAARAKAPNDVGAPRAAPRDCIRAKAMNGDVRDTSPCEKWMMFNTPNRRLNPTAMSAYMLPSVSQLSTCWTTSSVTGPYLFLFVRLRLTRFRAKPDENRFFRTPGSEHLDPVYKVPGSKNLRKRIRRSNLPFRGDVGAIRLMCVRNCS